MIPEEVKQAVLEKQTEAPKPKRKPAPKKKEVNYKVEHKKVSDALAETEQQLQMAQDKAEILFRENQKLKHELYGIAQKYEEANKALFESASSAFKMYALATKK